MTELSFMTMNSKTILEIYLSIDYNVINSCSDGVSQQLGGCLRDFRNKPFPIRAKIEYYKNILTVSMA